jgi:hypothetical protein
MTEAVRMQFSFSEVSARDLRGRTEADVFVNVEATLRIVDGDGEIYSETGFPVVELAAALRTWKSGVGATRSPFEFRSLSLEDRAVGKEASGKKWAIKWPGTEAEFEAILERVLSSCEHALRYLFWRSSGPEGGYTRG